MRRGRVEYDCADGVIEGPIRPDRAGRFTAAGTHTPGRGGPIREDEVLPSFRARYDGQINGWEIHPLVVAAQFRRQGVGRTLVHDLEDIVRQRGAVTLWAGSDDENNETTLSAVDLYADLPGAIRHIRNLGGHPYEFYLRVGFTIVGVVPDANGPGKPDICLAKRV